LQPPLEIDNYIVDEVSVKTNSSFDPNKGPTKVGVNFNCDIGQKTDDPLRYKIWLDFRLGDITPEASNMPYTIHLVINCFFHFAPGTKSEVMDKMLTTNGLAITYGIARGVISQATANGLFGKYLLPTVNLVDALKDSKTTRVLEEKSKTQAGS
jgi:preprotein translocase subunit SecB